MYYFMVLAAILFDSSLFIGCIEHRFHGRDKGLFEAAEYGRQDLLDYRVVRDSLLERLVLPYNRELKQEEAIKKTRRSTGKRPFKWNRGWLNFSSLAAASS